MTGDDHDLPAGPPFPVDLVADLHAGVLPEAQAQALWPRVMADPDGRRILAALDATRDELAEAPVRPQAPPAAVSAAIESTLAAIAAEQGRATSAAPVGAPVADLDDARDLRRDAARKRGLLIALAAAAVISVVTLVIAVSTASMSSQGTIQNAAPSATPSATGNGSAGGRDTPAITLLSVLGRTDAPFGPAAADAGRLRRCLAANGVAPDTTVVGSGVITVDGGPRTVILLSTGLAGRFDALVVGTNCDTGVPALISRQTIGATPPTR